MLLRAFDSAAAYLEVAESFLKANESLNSLPLGLALRARAGKFAGDACSRFFTIEEDGVLLGTLQKSPSHAIVFTRMSEDAARFAARELPRHLDPLIGCNGPREVVDIVAEVWRGLELGELDLHMGLRLFELTELTPARSAPGRLRLALDDDLQLCREWTYRFIVDCKMPNETPGQLPERVLPLEDRRLYLWEVDDQPVACAAWNRPMSEGVSIGYVYTPDELRGNGYASSLVSALSSGLLDGSLFQPARKRVNLFTDLANPTSNSIYQKLGYQPIGDFNHYMFKASEA